MVKSTRKSLLTDQEGERYFTCAYTKYLLKNRVFFPKEVLADLSLTKLMGGESYLDWNVAVMHIRDLAEQGKIQYSQRMKLEDWVLKANGKNSGYNIKIPQHGNKCYPAYADGPSPKDYVTDYEDQRLMANSQTVQEYEAEMLEEQLKKPSLTPADIEKQKKANQILNTKDNLNFKVKVPATDDEMKQEESRINEITEKEKKLEADNQVEGSKKRKLSIKEQSMKKRRIDSSGLRKLAWVTGETNFASLLTDLLGIPLMVGATLTARIDNTPDSTILNLQRPKDGKWVQFILDNNL